MESTSKALGGGFLLGAGLFQFSRLKNACLAHCRSPIGFWRPNDGTAHGGIQDGTEARRLLSRLLLGIDGPPVCLWRDEPVMGRLYQRLCPAGEDLLREPIGQPP